MDETALDAVKAAISKAYREGYDEGITHEQGETKRQLAMVAQGFLDRLRAAGWRSWKDDDYELIAQVAMDYYEGLK